MSKTPRRRPPSDYWAHTAHHNRNEHDRVVDFEMPRGGVSFAALLDRPPFRRLAGRRATMSGRGHRASQTLEAITQRRELVVEAWRLRVICGLSIREVAARVNRSPSLVGRWLRGIPAGGDRPLAALQARVDRLVAASERATERERRARSAAPLHATQNAQSGPSGAPGRAETV